MSGVVAGLVAKTIVYPLDVLKKRCQIRGAEHVRCKFGKVWTRLTYEINSLFTQYIYHFSFNIK